MDYFAAKFFEEQFKRQEYLGGVIMGKIDDILAKQVMIESKIMTLRDALVQAMKGVISMADADKILAGLDKISALADLPPPPTAADPKPPVDDNP